MAATKDASIAGLMEKIIKDSDGDGIQVNEVIESVGYRGFGPLLLFPVVITLLPTGALPFVPAVCGILIICLSLQIAFGRERPWLPEWIKKASLPKDKFEKSFKSKKPFIDKLDRLLAQRLTFLVKTSSQRVTGFIVSLLALMMIVIGFIPFAPDLFAVPILFFALGYMAQDGLVVLLGYIAVGIVLLFMPWLIGQI